MFTPNEIEAVPEYFSKLYRDLQLNIMTDVVQRLSINQEITSTADWRINRMYELGASKRQIKKYIKDTLDLSTQEINHLYKDVIRKGYARNENLYKTKGKPMIRFEDNKPLQQLITAVKEQTATECKNITQSLGFAVRQPDNTLKFESIADYYQNVLDKAATDILSGTFDYNTVLKKKVKEMTDSGLRTVDYASGWSNRIDVAARRAVMTGFNQIVAHITEENAEKLDTDYFEITYHIGARPTHQPWQGRVYSKQELETVCGYGTVTGLKGANCYHDFHPFFKGISKRTYSDDELDRMNKEENTPKKYGNKQYTTYEALQRQRKLETKMRAQRQEIKLLEEGGAAEEDITAAKSRYRVNSAEYTRFSKAMGLPQQRERVTIDGLGNIGANSNVKSKQKVAKSAESGIINEERENSPRKNRKKKFSVDWSKIQSSDYSDKFKLLSDNKKVLSAIETRAKWALNNRDGLDTEEIYAVDLASGNEVARITDQQYKQGVIRTSLFNKKLNEADNNGVKVLLLHNHPEGLPPSINDINILINNKNVSGITIGHNGSVYYYTRPKVPINKIDYNVKLRHYKNLDEVDCIEAALYDLQEKFGFKIAKL